MSDEYNRIREIAKREGPISSNQLAKVVAESGIYTAEQEANAFHRWVQARCRRALSEKGPDGTPLFGPVWAHESIAADEEDADTDERKAPLWVEKEQMTFPEIATWIEGEIKGIRADYDKVAALWRYCQERFGKAPHIPRLVDGGDGA